MRKATGKELVRTVNFEYNVDDSEKYIEGYAAKFNSWSEDFGGWRERINPGAFTKTLQENKDIYATYNHNFDQVLGRTSSGTLEVKEDENGLWFRVEIPNTTYGNDLRENMRRGDVRQCSFMFMPVKQHWNNDATECTILEARLFELGPVAMPAYKDTISELTRSGEPKADALIEALKEYNIEFDYVEFISRMKEFKESNDLESREYIAKQLKYFTDLLGNDEKKDNRRRALMLKAKMAVNEAKKIAG